jgi:transposase
LTCLRDRRKRVLLTMREINRLRVLQGYMDGKMLLEEAARILKRSLRSVYRMLAKVREKGPEGVLHGNRNKVSSRRVPEAVRKKVIHLAMGKYRDINDTHLCEILRKAEGIVMGRETLRGILRKEGIPSKRKVKRRKYRSRRERKEAFGMMLQLDASPHDWLQGRGPWLTLLGAKDDATGYVWAHFEEAETTWGYLDLMGEVISTHGVPLSLYADRHSIFHTTREPTIIEQLKDVVPLTQFGRAMEELGISVLKAWTPQAKGRIERQWGVFQDRLVVELRLAGASTLEQAREVLTRFLKDYNQRFCCLPKQAAAVFRKAPPKALLHNILCLKETRMVKKDHTVSFDGFVLQIPFCRKYPCIADRQVDVRQYRDGHLEIGYRGSIVARFSSEAVRRLVNTRSVQSNMKMAA